MSTRPLSFASTPANQLFGFELLRHDESSAAVSFRPRPEHTQEYGVVHGGIIAALADTAAVYTLYPFLDPATRMTSIEFKANFLAGAVPGNGDIVAGAAVVRKGRTVAVVRVEVHQGDTHVATGLFTYIFLRDGKQPA